MIDFKTFLTDNNVKQKDLADLVGVNPAFVSMVSKKKRKMPPEWKSFIEEHYNVNLDNYVVIDINLNRLRRELGLNQTEVAEIVGTHRANVSKAEKGEINISRDWINKLKNKYDFNIEDFKSEPLINSKFDLKRFRKDFGLSQKELGEILDTHYTFVSRYETSDRDIPKKWKDILTDCFGVNLSDYETVMSTQGSPLLSGGEIVSYINTPNECQAYYELKGTHLNFVNGDIIGVNEVSKEEIDPSKAYMILVNDQIMIKYLFYNSSNPEVITCKSKDHEDYTIETRQIKQIFLIKELIRNL